MAFAESAIGRRSARFVVGIVAIALTAAACSTASNIGGPTPPTGTASIPNQGGTNEGHTPIGFPGTGTGLFAGDNLNPTFPNGDGVQTYVTFTLPGDLTVDAAELRSDVLATSGSPFIDLGNLLAERVEYTTFGPDLFDLPESGNAVACTVVGGTTVSCDVTEAVQAALSAGAAGIQFRLRFERVSDSDGQADLAMFFRSDSNTNEEGLFTLLLERS